MTASRLALRFAVLALAVAAPLAARAAAPVPAPPSVNARAWLLVDHNTLKVLAEHNADAREEPASLTKLMTAYVVFQALADGRLKLTDEVTISKHAWKAEGSRTSCRSARRSRSTSSSRA